MIRAFAASLATAIVATSATAGGVDRSGQTIGAIFEPGNYVEFSFGSVNPKVSGIQVLTPSPPPSVLGSSSLDMTNGYGYLGLALKFAVTDNIDVAFIYDEPFGATIAYPFPNTYFASGSTASLSSRAFTAIGKYRFGERFSVYGGVRQQNLSAAAMIPFIPGGYMATGGWDDGTGYLLGAAYERPDIALRVALTYNSTVTHNLPTVETSALGAGRASTTNIVTPQSINLDFQTGIAPKTLLFGSVRWVEWSEFDISPADYASPVLVGAPLVSYADDTITYSLGVGRQFSETWSGAISVTHEPQTGGLRSNLSPTDGRTAIGVGMTYRQDNMKLQAGLQHIWIGDAVTSVFGTPGGDFSGNTALAFGMKVGFSF